MKSLCSFAVLLVFLLTACGQVETSTPTVPASIPAPTLTTEETPSSAPTGAPTSTGSDYTKMAEDFVNLLAQEEFAKAVERFDATMKQQLPEAKLAETWKGLITQVGPFKRQIGTRTQQVQQYDVVFVTTEFENGNIDVQVTFNKDGEIAGLFFKPAADSNSTPSAYEPPTYVKQDAFQEQEVKVGTGEWELPGTLTLPAGDGPFPAVVLVHGSGPQDRDETIGPNKPFRDLALGLASQGIAVLRYDKRTKVYPEKMSVLTDSITLDPETVDDALAAVSLLRNTDKIDKDRIYVLGHSLGGMAAPRIAAKDAEIAGLVIMAGLTRPFEDTVLDQYTYIFSLDGTISADEQKQLDDLKTQAALVKSPDLSKDTPASQLPLGVPAAYWMDLRDYHPTEMAKGLQQPMLILQGEADYQVTMEDFQGWKDALKSRSNVEFKSYPKLFHLFMPSQADKATPADYEVPGHVTEQVVTDIADWIKQQ